MKMSERKQQLREENAKRKNANRFNRTGSLHKHGTRTVGANGVEYRSKFEASLSHDLSEIAQLAYEANRLSYHIPHVYVPDWSDSERKIILEIKGLFDADERQKILAIKKCNPDWTICFIFMNDKTKITKTSKTSYRDWCEKNGIQVFGTIDEFRQKFYGTCAGG